MRFTSFAEASLAQGAFALNRVFEHYLVPVTFSADHLDLHLTYNDIDAAASPLWYDDDGNVAAAALLGVRGDRGWIGGFGVAPEYRGRGHARELLEAVRAAARERALRTIQLEVLSGNEPAIGLYRSGGFAVTRTLRSLERSLDADGNPGGFSTSPLGELIDRPDGVRPCWQRERRTLQNGAVSTAITDGRDFALFRYNSQAAQIFKIGVAGAAELESVALAISNGRGVARILIMNEPEDSPITAYAKTAHWNEPFTQYEMVLELD